MSELNYQSLSEDGSPGLEPSRIDAPVSGVRHYYEQEDDPDFGSGEAAVIGHETPPVPADAEAIPQKSGESWIGGLLARLKQTVSTPPPARVEKGFVPFEEQNLAEMLEIEESKVVLFRSIVSNRERLLLSVSVSGAFQQGIDEIVASRLDPVLTEAWRQRLQEQLNRAAGLKLRLQTMRANRLARESSR